MVSWREEVEATARERWSGLVAYAYLLTGDLPLAEDLVQEAFARAFGRVRRVKDPAVMHAYLRSTVRHLVIDGYRHEKVATRSAHLVTGQDTTDSPEATLTLRLDVQQALDQLPARERACVVLRYYDDLTVPALAAELRISPGTAKRYLSDAIHRLEATLGPLDPPAETSVVHLTEEAGR